MARERLARGCTVYRTIAEDRGRASRKRRSNGTARDGETDRERKREVVRSWGSGANICLPPGKLKAHREERIETGRRVSK